MIPISGAALVAKMQLLFSLMARRPAEVFDRVLAIADVRWDSLCYGQATPYASTVRFSDVLDKLGEELNAPIHDILQEPSLLEITAHVEKTDFDKRQAMPFTRLHSADITLAQLSYITCRALRPEIVIETGVAYGVTSAFVLQAMQANGTGRLHSIDLPPLARQADDYVGMLIPAGLRQRWTLHRGTSRRLLPSLLEELGSVDVFIHDSLHTYRNIIRELSTVRPHLKKPGIVIADDVDDNPAFDHWVREAQPTWSAIVRERHKTGLFGVAAFRE